MNYSEKSTSNINSLTVLFSRSSFVMDAYALRKYSKYYDRPIGFVPTQTGTVTVHNNLTQGTSATNYVGRTIHMHQVNIKLSINPSPPPAVVADQRVRIILYYDTQNNNASTPSITDLMESSSSLSYQNWPNKERFIFLLDKTYPVGRLDPTATVAVSSSPSNFFHEEYISLELPTVFTSGDGINTGVLASFVYTTASVPSNVIVGISTRIFFSDS